MARLRASIIHSVLAYYAAAVTVIPPTLNLPRPYESDNAPSTSDSDLLSRLHAGAVSDVQPVLSTYAFERMSKVPLQGVYPSQDSFFHGAIDAGAKHQHLVIQPQDV
jgi:hypothetical protein